jgi:hypothetical protein
MRAGVTDHVWSVEAIVGLLDFAKCRPKLTHYGGAGTLPLFVAEGSIFTCF